MHLGEVESTMKGGKKKKKEKKGIAAVDGRFLSLLYRPYGYYSGGVL